MQTKTAKKAAAKKAAKEPNRKGETMSGYVPHDDAKDVREFMASRKRSLTDTISECVRVGLPILKKMYPPVKQDV